MSDEVDVQESGVHGYGVFATVDLEAGHCIRVPFVVLDDDDTDTTWNNSFGGWYPSPEVPWAYLNHSEKANAEMVHDEDEMHLELLQDVKQGEEILINYGEDYDWKNA